MAAEESRTSEISAEEGIARARAEIGVDASAPASVWGVRWVDRPGEAYYLVVFGEERGAIAVAAVDTTSGEVKIWARLPGTRAHLTIGAEEAVGRAALAEGASAELVWRPCRASRSPLYPLWEVRSGAETVWVDQQGVAWKDLEPAGPGG